LRATLCSGDDAGRCGGGDQRAPYAPAQPRLFVGAAAGASRGHAVSADITRPALSDERVQINAAGQMGLKHKQGRETRACMQVAGYGLAGACRKEGFEHGEPVVNAPSAQ